MFRCNIRTATADEAKIPRPAPTPAENHAVLLMELQKAQMNSTSSKIRIRTILVMIVLLLICCVLLVRQRPAWISTVQARLSGASPRESASPAHENHDHEHSHGTGNANLLVLSLQARQNLGLNANTVKALEPSTFRRKISVPAIIAARPGRTILHVSAPLTGVIQHVHAVTGETVTPQTVLFRIRLTHEDLVQTQTEFLQMLGELDVEFREVQRLESVAETGAIAGKTLLERHYSRDKLQAQLLAKREALRLHGLSDRQIQEIEQTRHLLRELTILAPVPDDHRHDEELHLSDRADASILTAFQDAPEKTPASVPLILERLFAQTGQSVSAGDPLCTLADYHRLYIEGKAFELDASAVSRAAQKDWTISALFNDGLEQREITGLKLGFVANSIDPDSRTLSFFVDLPNEILHDETNAEHQRFVTWRYRIGQRLQLLVPVEEWPDELVVPVEAVVRDGVESYVFQRKAGNFERVPVHVKYRDQQHVVIAKDGLIKPGTLIALRSAHQMQMALKNMAGGGIDPHAGHNH